MEANNKTSIDFSGSRIGSWLAAICVCQRATAAKTESHQPAGNEVCSPKGNIPTDSWWISTNQFCIGVAESINSTACLSETLRISHVTPYDPEGTSLSGWRLVPPGLCCAHPMMHVPLYSFP
ncbi:hypothetical protein CIB84_003347 [Bambusicola thoracicus]|uniref:Uncharacterized protein n=1 Tax=Bambusicola thoracicus TaxID=9083 RepID=A0A2P4T981_BAMTH|nr:hypothetical protein CIB84_003347 [Bambusicola thoracicus]